MRYLAILLMLSAFPLATAAQQYEVIIGSFREKANADRFTANAKKVISTTQLKFKEDRGLYHVIGYLISGKQEALSRLEYLHSQTAFTDAWLLCISDCDGEQTIAESAPAIAIVVAEESTPAPPPVVVEESDPIEIPAAALVEPTPTPSIKGKLFVFRITDKEGNSIPGEVHYVDRKKENDFISYKANEPVEIIHSVKDDPSMPIVCAIFKYKEHTHFINYDNPEKTLGVFKEGDTWVVPYILEPLTKGDVSIMYKVTFYKDAVIMEPQSKDELDVLLSIMNANPKMEIKIHGHVNGAQEREIKTLSDGADYFDLSTAESVKASAEKLGTLRAEAVQRYLVANGINKNRLKLYSWGNRRQLVPESSTQSQLNDRIEIEVLKN